MENLTVLPYLRIYFRVLNAIEKSCFETLHTTSCVARTALDRLCPEVGRSSTLRRNLLLPNFSIFVVSREWPGHQVLLVLTDFFNFSRNDVTGQCLRVAEGQSSPQSPPAGAILL